MHAEAHDRRNYYRDGSSITKTGRLSDEYTTSSSSRGSTLGIAGAAVALAELHSLEPDRDTEMDGVSLLKSHSAPATSSIVGSSVTMTLLGWTDVPGPPRIRYDRDTTQTLTVVAYREPPSNSRHCI